MAKLTKELEIEITIKEIKRLERALKLYPMTDDQRIITEFALMAMKVSLRNKDNKEVQND